MRKMLPKCAISAAAVMILAVASPAWAQFRVRVLDEQNRGVAGTVRWSAGNSWEHLTYTDASGTSPAIADWNCQAGRRLVAHPGDTETYYDSPPQDCSSRQPLRVLFRPRRGRAAGPPLVQRISSQRGGPAYYLLLRPTVAATAVESRGRNRCSYRINASIERTLYREADGGEWYRVELPAAGRGVPALPQRSTVDREVVASSCAAAADRIATAERAAAETPQYPLAEIAAYQTGPIARRVGVLREVRLTAPH